jgi:serine/threonine protein kinase
VADQEAVGEPKPAATVTAELAAIAASGAKTVVDPAVAAVRPTDFVPAIPDHTLLRRVGKGAYGEVWLARNAIGTYHAVKIIRREDFEESEPFEREFRGLQKFMPISHAHPGLVLILHVGRYDQEGFIYYIMEAADDEATGAQINPTSYSPKNLAREIRQRGHLSAAECLRLGLDLTAALDFLHRQNLIHRDIKPANIIFVKGTPKFADIGLVTDIARTGQAVTQIGTEGYIAPEGPGTPAADVYSLGKVLYEAGTGMGRDMFPELPSNLAQRPDHAELLRLNQVLLKACRQNPGQRYRTAAEMREHLLALRCAFQK